MYLLNKLDRMDAVIDDLHKAVYNLTASMASMLCTNNSQSTHTANITTQSQSQAGGASSILQAGSAQSLAYMTSEKAINLHFPSLGKPAVDSHPVQSTVQQKQKQNVNTPSWADISENHGYTSTESQDSRDEQDGFTSVVSPRRKRARSRSNQQQAAISGSVSTSYASVIADATSKVKPKPKPAPGIQERPAGGNKNDLRSKSKSSRRGPLFVGKRLTDGSISNLQGNLQGARPMKQVFCIDNVGLTVTADDLTTFVTGLGVRVISCFKVDARMSNYQRKRYKEPDHNTFRLCINKVDRDSLLKPDAWPADIIVSLWVFKPRPLEVVSETQQSTDSDRVRTDDVTQKNSNLVTGAGSTDADVDAAAAAALDQFGRFIDAANTANTSEDVTLHDINHF